jgi:L-rhamnose mutarotase
MNKRYVLALDLQEDPALIATYEKYHQQVWPEVRESIRYAGIVEMEIYRWETRLFMIMEVDDTFSFEKKAALDASNPKVQEWEELMWKFQKALPGIAPDEKWQQMKMIFRLNS